jgi:hypothetical protein
VVHADGTIFTIDGDSVVGIDPTTGQPKFSVQMDHSTSTSNGVSSDSPPMVGNLIVAGDGNAYVAYQYSQGTYAVTQSSSTASSTSYLNVLRVGSDGDSTKIVVKQ